MSDWRKKPSRLVYLMLAGLFLAVILEGFDDWAMMTFEKLISCVVVEFLCMAR